MSLPKILFLTNSQNGASDEDAFLINFISKDFDMVVSHPLDCLPLLNNIKGIIIRNIWPTEKYDNEWREIETIINKTDIPTYNSLTGKGDHLGKDYLVSLYRQGFPVIPSVDNIQDIDLLGKNEYYWIKPKQGCDGSGAGKFTKEELQKQHLIDYIIQPYVEFISEPSFFFIDTIFSHAITMPNRLADKDIKLYQPTKEDLDFARKFIEWNSLKHGIQRVDAIRTMEGNLLLTEVEDVCPYLYIDDIGSDQKKLFLKEIRDSILRLFSSVV